MTATGALLEPDVQDGIEYWNTQPASYDGVLGELSHPTLSPSS